MMSDTSSVEDSRIEIEREKLAIERKKLDLEIVKAKWTRISIGVPFLVVLATIAYGVFSAGMQAKQAFRLEAAKTVMTADTAAEQVSRATFLRTQFSEELGSNFLAGLDLKNFVDAPNVSAKFRFIRFVAPQGLNAHETAELYHYLFREDDQWSWNEEIQALLKRASLRSSK